MSDGNEQEASEAEALPEAASGRKRRGVLSAMAGGFALAAGGLLRPAWLEETKARPGAKGGELGGRRGKDHRGRKKRHGKRHNRDRDRSGPRGGSPSPLGISITMNYYVSEGKTHTEFWTARTSDWAKEQSLSLEPGDKATFQTKRTGAVVWLAGSYYASFNTQTDPPTVTLGHGGTFGAHGWSGGTIFADAVPLEWSQKTPGMEIDDRFIQVIHTFDKDNNALFILLIDN